MEIEKMNREQLEAESDKMHHQYFDARKPYPAIKDESDLQNEAYYYKICQLLAWMDLENPVVYLTNKQGECNHIYGYDDDYDMSSLVRLDSIWKLACSYRFKYCPLCGADIYLAGEIAMKKYSASLEPSKEQDNPGNNKDH